MKTDLSRYNNSWYNPGGGFVGRLLWYFINNLIIRNRYNPFSVLRVVALRLFGARIGRGVVIKPGVNIKYPWHLSIGDYSWIGEDVWIENFAEVNIGNNCCISQGAMLLCGNHNYRSETFDLIIKPITVMDGAWIGAKSIVCPGVTVGREAVLSVGSVAVDDLRDGYVYQDCPAKEKGTRF